MLLTRLGDGLVCSNDVQAPKSRIAGCDTVRGRLSCRASWVTWDLNCRKTVHGLSIIYFFYESTGG